MHRFLGLKEFNSTVTWVWSEHCFPKRIISFTSASLWRLRLHWGQTCFGLCALASVSSHEDDWGLDKVCSCHTDETPNTNVHVHPFSVSFSLPCTKCERMSKKNNNEKITSVLRYPQQRTQIAGCQKKEKASVSLDSVSEYLSIKRRPKADRWDEGMSTS